MYRPTNTKTKQARNCLYPAYAHDCNYVLRVFYSFVCWKLFLALHWPECKFFVWSVTLRWRLLIEVLIFATENQQKHNTEKQVASNGITVNKIWLYMSTDSDQSTQNHAVKARCCIFSLKVKKVYETVSNVKLMLVLQNLLTCTIPVVLIQYVTIRQAVYTQHFIMVIQTATRFGCTIHPSLASRFINIKKKSYSCSYTHNSKNSPLYKLFVNITFEKNFYYM
jgi:hypothetical protein